MTVSSNSDNGQLELVLKESDVEPAIEAMFARLLNEVDEFQNLKSGFKWKGSIRLDIWTSKWQRGIGRTVATDMGQSKKKAGSYVPSPRWVQKKKCVINMHNDDELDDKCFAWVLLRARYPLPKNVGGRQRCSVTDLVSHLDEVSLPKGVTYPIPLDDKVRLFFFCFF